MKLIDVLVMISKGELKEGTRVKYKISEGSYVMLIVNDGLLKYEKNNKTISFGLSDLKIECELIEPQMATEKIEELDVLGIGENRNIDNLGLASSMCDLRNSIRETQRKLNEVIRRINNERL